jgi:hypothetical protein
VTIQGSLPFCNINRIVLYTFCCQVRLLYKFKDYVRRIHIHQTVAILDPNTTEEKIRLGYGEDMLKNTECVHAYDKEANHGNVGNCELSL